MIVCHCNRIDHVAIEETSDVLAAADPWRVLTAVSVYKAMGKRPCCGSCLPLAANIIHTRHALDRTDCATCPLASLAGTNDNPEGDVVMEISVTTTTCSKTETRFEVETLRLFAAKG